MDRTPAGNHSFHALRYRAGMHDITIQRKALGLSLRQLAQACGLRPQKLSEIECGHSLPSAPERTRLEERLGMKGLPCKDQLLNPRCHSVHPYVLPSPTPTTW